MNESSSTLPVLLQEGMEDLQKDFAQEEQEQEGREEGEGGALTAACSCYLDHAGATLASRRQLQDVFRALTAAPLSNPHSMGPLGSRCEDTIAACRLQVLRHFGADPSDYDCVFTSGATAALKLVAESFPWAPESALVHPYNTHTSVLGMREYAPSTYCVPSSVFHCSASASASANKQMDSGSDSISDSDSDSSNDSSCDSGSGSGSDSDNGVFYSLLTVPGECNFSGMKMDRPLRELQTHSRSRRRRQPQPQPQPQPGTTAGGAGDTGAPPAVPGLLLPSAWPSRLAGAVAVKLDKARLPSSSSSSSSAAASSSAFVPSSPTQSSGDSKRRRRRRRRREVFLWMLDASKLASTSEIDLSRQGVPPRCHTAQGQGQAHGQEGISERELATSRPHFLCASFYKIFGYPTGVGALLVRRDVTPLLQKRYFGGGAVSGVVASANVVQRPAAVREAGRAHLLLEDGTLNYHGIAGFKAVQRAGGMANIQRFTFQLAQHLHAALASLHHTDTDTDADIDRDSCNWRRQGRPLCEIYGRHDEHSSSAQGSIVTFNVRWADGDYVGFGEVGEKAAAEGIQLRVGCFCSMGGCQEALGMSAADVQRGLQQGRTCQDGGGGGHDLAVRQQRKGERKGEEDEEEEGGGWRWRPTGAVRVSVGYMTDPRQATTRLLAFLRRHFLDQTAAVPLSPPTQPLPGSGSGSGSALSDWSREEETKTEDEDEGEQLDAQVSAAPPLMPPRSIYLHSIYVYPIKSCAGFKVKAWPLGASGLCLDREWVVISAVTGIALTQKSHPLLSRCLPEISLSQQLMTVSAPPSMSLAPLVLSLTGKQGQGQGQGQREATTSSSSPSSLRQIRVCYSQHVAQRCLQGGADAWFSAVLGLPCQLVRRSVSNSSSATATAPAMSSSSSFSNTAQFLLLSMNSLRLLQMKMSPASSGSHSDGSEVARVESFRPNFVVDQTPPLASSSSSSSFPSQSQSQSQSHEEDSWRAVTFPLVPHAALPLSHFSTSPPPPPTAGGCDPVTLLSSGPCARCSMVNIVSPPPRAGSGVDYSMHPPPQPRNSGLVKGSGGGHGSGDGDSDGDSGAGSGSASVPRNPNTLKTLATYRKGQHGVGSGSSGGSGRNDIYFGQYFAYDTASQDQQHQEHPEKQSGDVVDDGDGYGDGEVFLSRGFVYEHMPLHVQHANDMPAKL